MADYINKIRTTEGDKPVNYEALANKPNSLPNPNKIKFTGSVVAEYDGSSEVTVNIPNGASEEQAAQIQTNTNDISELKNKTSELKSDLVDESEKYFVTIPLSDNRFDWNAEPSIDGYYFSGNGERMTSNSNYYITDYILIEGGKSYYQTFQSACVLYDKFKNYIRTIRWNESPFVADDNAKYIRCSVKKSEKTKLSLSEKDLGRVDGLVTPFTGDKVEVINEYLKKELYVEKQNILEYEFGMNRFNKNDETNEYGKYIQNGLTKDGSDYFITHLMIVEPNTTYYSNEAGDGIFYDEKMNVIGVTRNAGMSVTTPTNCKYYKRSASISIKNKLYVSKTDNLCNFTDILKLSDNAKNAVDERIEEKTPIIVREELEKNPPIIYTDIISEKTSEHLNGVSTSKKPLVTFIDDDGDINVYSALFPLAQQKNFKFGMALVTDRIGKSDGCMTLEQVKEIHDSGLGETLSHCFDNYNKMPTLSESELRRQYSLSKKWLLDNGLDAYAFVYPQNTSDKLSRKVAREYYDYCFIGINWNTNTLDHSLINRLAFGSYESYNPYIEGIDGKDTLQYYKACVDKAIADGTWLIFNTHVGSTGTHSTSEQISMLSELIDYIRENNVDIVKPSEGFALKRNVISFGDKEELHMFVGESVDTNLFGTRIVASGNITNSSPITEYQNGMISVMPVSNSDSVSGGFPTNSGGILKTYAIGKPSDGYSYQEWLALGTGKQYVRFWKWDNTGWTDWIATN